MYCFEKFSPKIRTEQQICQVLNRTEFGHNLNLKTGVNNFFH